MKYRRCWRCSILCTTREGNQKRRLRPKISRTRSNEISAKIEKTTSVIKQVREVEDQLDLLGVKMQKSCEALDEISEREVLLDPELKTMREEMKEVYESLVALEGTFAEVSGAVADIKKENKALFDQEILKRLEDGKIKLEKINAGIKDNTDKLGKNEKKLRYLKDEVAKAKAKQGLRDEALTLKLEELELEEAQLEKDVGDLTAKLKETRQKKLDATVMLEKFEKNPKQFQPNQVEGLMVYLEEIGEKCSVIEDKMGGAEKTLDEKISVLDTLLKSSEDKHLLQKKLA